MNKIKRNDVVVIIAGKDKGKKGPVISVLRDGEAVIVDGLNLAKKHVKGNPNTGEKGGITTKPMPIHRSNVMVFDPNKNKGSRVGIRKLKDGQRVRYFKGSDQLVDVKA